MILQSGHSYTLNAFLDVQSYNAAEQAGLTTAEMASRIQSQLGARYGITRVAVEVTRNYVVSDVINIRLNITPVSNLDTVALGEALLMTVQTYFATAGARASNVRALATPHSSRGSALGVISQLLTVGFVTWDSFIVDESSVREGNVGGNPPTASTQLSRAVGALAGSRTVSDDPNRNNRGTGETGEGLAWYWILAISGGAALVVGIGVAYVVRSFK